MASNERTLSEVLRLLFAQGWSVPIGLVGIIGPLVPILIPEAYQPGHGLPYRFLIAALIFVLIFCIKLAIQLCQSPTAGLRKLAVIRAVSPELMECKWLLHLEGFVGQRDNVLLTLYTKGNEVPQALCVLRVTDASEPLRIQAVQLMPNEEELDLTQYFREHSRLQSLYALPTIHMGDLTGGTATEASWSDFGEE